MGRKPHLQSARNLHRSRSDESARGSARLRRVKRWWWRLFGYTQRPLLRLAAAHARQLKVAVWPPRR